MVKVELKNLTKILSVKQLAIVTALFLCWRIVLFVIGNNSGNFFPYEPSFPYWDSRIQISPLPRWFSYWASFDGVHYLTIADVGYLQALNTEAFFPVFPLGVSLIREVLRLSYIESGMLLSNLSMFAFLTVFFIYVKDRFSESLAWKALFVLLTFPTAFFFGAIYAESIFLLFVVLAFWCSRKRWWFFAGIVTVLATATRLVGVFLIPALLIDLFFQQYQVTRKTNLHELLSKLQEVFRQNWLSILWILTGITGLGLYMYFLWMHYQDPLYFFSVQSDFGAGRSQQIVLFPQVVWRQIKILFTVSPDNWKYYTFVQDFVVTLGVLIILCIGVVKRKLKAKISELFFSFSAFLLPTLTGTFSSMPRYVLVCFPIFFLIPQLIKNKWWFAIYLLGSSLFLVLNVMLFIQGYWVA